MRTFLKHTLITGALLFILVVGAFGQTEADLVQALNKALVEVEAARAELKAKDNVIALQEKLIAQQGAVIEAQKAENDAKQVLINELRAIKCNETRWVVKPLILPWPKIEKFTKECY